MNLVRKAAVPVALVVAFALAGGDRVPLSLLTPDAIAASGDVVRKGTQYDLSAMRVMARVVNYLKENYVDPHRIKPREMMVGALEAVEKSVPEVMVEGTAESGKIKVNVGGKTKEFDMSRVDSLWKMSYNMKDVFDFIAKNMRPIDEPRDVEYAAVNGMLQTLDPHSILLRPEQYREMKAQTKGEFGGLGFLIRIQESVLTVLQVYGKTPAARAGIKKNDQILRIGDDSTINLNVTDAVSKLRGPVDTKVTITVNRKGWDKPQQMTLTRALITIESVQSKLLSKNIGYVRLKNFQGNTSRDLEVALGDLESQAKKASNSAKGIKGLVLDMRGNPGGLLEQALQVSDFFLSTGTIVTTVGYSDKLRDERRAHEDDSDDAYPVVVLVNGWSASASEIVAGALKNNNRAVIIGRPTFGKGSVQMLYDFPDESALKLTIAKYLTPGDISIQEVGIIPDIELVPSRVAKGRIDVFAPKASMGEADLDHHFSNPASAKAATKRGDVVATEKPSEILTYLRDEPTAKKEAETAETTEKVDKPKVVAGGAPEPLLPEEAPLDDQVDAELTDEFHEDFEVRFARDYLVAAPAIRRDEMLRQGKAFVEQTRAAENKRIGDALTALNIDWAPGPSPKVATLTGVLKPGPDKRIVAGDTLQIELAVTNNGREPISRLRAWLESDNWLIDKREFVFGRLRPGEKRTWSAEVKVPKSAISRRDAIRVKYQDDSGIIQENEAGEISFVELPRPKFAYTYSVVDDCAVCNQDGRVQRGEAFNLVVEVTNVGMGKALDAFGNIRNGADSTAFIEKGRVKFGALEPGQTKSASFSLEVKRASKADELNLQLAVLDESLDEFMADKLKIQVQSGLPIALEPRRASVVKLADRAPLYSAADEKRVLAILPKGAVLTETARGTAVARVELSKDVAAFARLSDTKDAKGAKAAPPKDVDWQQIEEPAKITLNVDSTKGGIVVDSDKFVLSGVIEDAELLDFFVMVNDQKVFYRSKQAGDTATVKFTAEVPLKEGANLVRLIARNTEEFATQKNVFIRRSVPALAAAATVPKAAP